ncbi:YidB family protein [Aquabacterium sp.]|uniref:YidB family protein n=1 Tax=Aquabacterium sp. TaxID=1872578 RepID=UPI002C8951B8|nr:YidB family protein [Aquabacterium sp.]HSW07062.1 YidB family protein [Aquabacterium sp.]
MGLLDAVIGSLGGAQPGGGGGQAALLQAVMSLLSSHGEGGAGLAGLVAQLSRGGLGDVVGSWVGTGQNLPVSADQLQDALGSDVVGDLAQQTGMNTGDLLGQLSQMLPRVVDQLTPQGQLPQGGLGDLGGLLGGLLNR